MFFLRFSTTSKHGRLMKGTRVLSFTIKQPSVSHNIIQCVLYFMHPFVLKGTEATGDSYIAVIHVFQRFTVPTGTKEIPK